MCIRDSYNDANASNYQASSRVKEIQKHLSKRALGLLDLPAGQSCMLLDIGSGTGLSGQQISACGHQWLGFDISPEMLNVAVAQGCQGDVFAQDAGAPFRFRSGCFDGAISISAIQWLVNDDYNQSHTKLITFFKSLKKALAPGARAVLQFYPEAADHVGQIASAAGECGLKGGLVLDYPNSAKGKKFFMCVQAPGRPSFPALEKAVMEKKRVRASKKAVVSQGKKARMEKKAAKGGWAPGMWRAKKKEAEQQQQDEQQEPEDGNQSELSC
eukprot:TRINITY_DN6899_c0_g1_i1.p1 TRINITY_DN6899_c0_g1~~TRINITY_DN6899_c0_g1_i1.p1  ORF type:complete len:271 (+),score=101.57 TRINITY_DN6899_c0_g1_i1:150-962(+)